LNITGKYLKVWEKEEQNGFIKLNLGDSAKKKDGTYENWTWFGCTLLGNAKDVEVEFALAASEILGEQRKIIADNRDTEWTKAIGAILLSAGGILFGIDEIGKLYKVYKTPLRVRRIVRGRRLAEKLKSGEYENLATRQKKDLHAFVVNARKKELTHGIVDDVEDSALKALKAIRELDEGLESAATSWMAKVDRETLRKLEPFLHRSDINALMDDAADLVQRALKGKDGDAVLKLMRYAPHKTREQLEHGNEAMRKRVTKPQGKPFYKQADETDTGIADELAFNDWHFKGKKSANKDTYCVTFTDPSGGCGSALRGWDDATNTFKMKAVFRDDAEAWIAKGLDKPLVPGRGVPTIMYANMRAMNAFGIGYAGKGGKLMKHVTMEHIINPRSALQLEWIRKTYFPQKSFVDIVRDGSINEYARHCFTVKYAEDAFTMSGYRIKGVRIELDKDFTAGGFVGGLKDDYVGTVPWEDLIKRYDLNPDDEVNTFYNIMIDVEPY